MADGCSTRLVHVSLQVGNLCVLFDQLSDQIFLELYLACMQSVSVPEIRMYLADCGEGNVTVYKGKTDKDKSRLPNSTMECGYCEDGFRFDGARQECVKCSAKIECKNSGIKRSPCQDLTQYFDHNEDECLGCPENSVCTSLSTPVPKPQFIPKNREQLANIMKILLPYWIDESDPNSIPLGRECFSKRKDDRNADCDVPCGQNVAAENCRIAACPAGTVMIRAPGNTDVSFQDRCFQCPAGFFQIFSTNHYNLKTLQPSSGLEDPILMCSPCPSGTSCSRSKAQERDFGFTVGIHILPSNGFWLNSLLLHEMSGTFIYVNDSLRPSRRVEEDVEDEEKKTFREESAEMVTAHRCTCVCWCVCSHVDVCVGVRAGVVMRGWCCCWQWECFVRILTWK